MEPEQLEKQESPETVQAQEAEATLNRGTPLVVQDLTTPEADSFQNWRILR